MARTYGSTSVRIEIDCDNSAFQEAGEGNEVGRILTQLVNQISGIDTLSMYSGKLTLRDANGNIVGSFEVIA